VIGNFGYVSMVHGYTPPPLPFGWEMIYPCGEKEPSLLLKPSVLKKGAGGDAHSFACGVLKTFQGGRQREIFGVCFFSLVGGVL